MGRHPKPTALRLLEGNREHRTIRAELEPRPERVAPPCPHELKGDARRAWRYIVRELGRMHVLASSDRGQMAAYCDAWGEWCKGRKKLAEMSAAAGGGDVEMIRVGMKTTRHRDGSVTEDSGRLVTNPWVIYTRKARADIARYGAELGLNPVQRTRIKMDIKPARSLREELSA
jgi:P27 family predicted phage terminase small subunit